MFQMLFHYFDAPGAPDIRQDGPKTHTEAPKMEFGITSYTLTSFCTVLASILEGLGVDFVPLGVHLGSNLAPKNAPEPPKSAQKPPKTGQELSKSRPRRPGAAQDPPRTRPGGPRQPKSLPRADQDAQEQPRTCPGLAQDPPRTSQNRSRPHALPAT